MCAANGREITGEGVAEMGVADRFYTPGQDTSKDGIEVDYTEHILQLHGDYVHVYEWLPPLAPGQRAHALVHISHGVGEHARRYQRFIRHLLVAGYAVIAHDQLGHGRTGVRNYGLGQLGPVGMPGARRVVLDVINWAKARHPGLPFVEFSHSWGSLMSQQLFAARPHLADAVVFSGTSLAFPGFINVGEYNDHWNDLGIARPHRMDWISRDEVEIQRLNDDLYGFDVTKSVVFQPQHAIHLAMRPPLPRCGRAAEVPVYILVGSEDPMGYWTRGAKALDWVMRKLYRMRNVTLRIFPGSRHEVLNDLDRDQATTELIDWLNWRFVPPQPAATERA